jgi:hypothetical protein
VSTVGRDGGEAQVGHLVSSPSFFQLPGDTDRQELTRWFSNLLRSLASNPSSSNEASSQLQEQLQTALHLHQDSLSTLSLKESELASLRSRLETLSQGSKGAVGTLAQKLDEAERELRIAKEGRKNAEVKVELLKEEVAVGRGKGSVGGGGFRGVGGVGNSMGQEERLRQLEGLLEMYKGKLKEIGRESGMAEAKVAEGMGYVKKALLEEAEGKVGSLQQGTSPVDHPPFPPPDVVQRKLDC